MGSVVQSAGTSLTTTFASATQLTAVIPAAQLSVMGSLSVTVTNPAPGGGVSNSATLTVVGLLGGLL